MVVVPTRYPSGSPDDEIIGVIAQLSNELISTGANINDVMQKAPLITIGQAELQKRFIESNHKITTELHKETTELKQITKEYSESSEKFSDASKRIAITALIISTLAVIISLYFGITSDKENKDWQTEQIFILRNISNKINSYK